MALWVASVIEKVRGGDRARHRSRRSADANKLSEAYALRLPMREVARYSRQPERRKYTGKSDKYKKAIAQHKRKEPRGCVFSFWWSREQRVAVTRGRLLHSRRTRGF